MASDYFAALMRASGLAAPAGAISVADPPAAAADGIVEQQLLRPAAPLADAVPPLAAPAALPAETALAAHEPEAPTPAVVQTLTVGPHVPAPPEAPAAPATAALATDARPPVPHGPIGLPQAEAGVEAREVQGTPPAAQPEELRHALMRVALNWVHGGVAVDASGESVSVPEQTPVLPPEVRANPDPPPVRDAPPVPAATPRLPALPEARRALAVDAVRLAPPVDEAAWSGTAPPRGGASPETLEISIGAIHLRVDAPPVQAAPPPEAPPTPSAATMAAQPKRGDFERRLLRRL